MNKMLMFMLMMSLMSVSCNKSGGGSDGQASTTTEPVQSGIDDTASPTDSTANSGSTADTTANDGGTTDTPTNGGDTTPAPIVVIPVPISTLPALALSFMTNIQLINFNSIQADKYEKATELVKLVVGTEEFRTKVLNHTWNGAKQYADNGGKTNEQIYQSILDAAERLRPAKNNTLDLEAELYYANNSVVGYTNGSVTQIWVNTKFFNTYEPNQVAGNLFHEWLHKLGYGHDAAATAKRPYSVPYAVGYMIRDIGKKFL